MLYCPPNITFNELWIIHGTSQCYLETVSSAFIFTFIFIFGGIQFWMYKKYSTELPVVYLPRSVLYRLQQIFTVILVLLAITRFILKAAVFSDAAVYGYMITSLLYAILVFPISLFLMGVERLYLLPSVPTRGHGLILLLFWTFLLVVENLAFLNLQRQDWWFHLQTFSDKMEMALFVLRYGCCLFLFVLGLRAPGLMTNRDYFNLDHSSMTSIINSEERETTVQGSTFRNAWKKMKILAPFIWPKKDIILQFYVIFCLLLLASGRVINLFVPIYNGLIVDSMKETSQNLTELKFRWDLVLIYVGFKFLQGGGTGGMGLLNNLRSFLWIRITQYTTREVEVTCHRLT